MASVVSVTARITIAMALAAALQTTFAARLEASVGSALPTELGSAQAVGDPLLALTLNQSTFRPGQALAVSVSVVNPGGGPACDFYLLIRLPDGATTASIRLGAPPVFGSLANLRSLAPVVGGVNLGGPFSVSQTLFQYAFNGSEPPGGYVVYFLAVRSGAFGNGSLDPGELLALQTQSFVFSPQPGAPTVEIDQTAVLLPQQGDTRQLSATAKDGFGNPLPGPITWTSSRPNQVSVDSTGVVRAVVANGSSQIIARAGGPTSAPLLVIATQTPAGATLVTDAQIVGGPVESTPEAPPSADNTYRVVLRGVPPPAIGSLLINTGSQAVAGKVLAVDVAGSDVTVTLGLASLPELFPALEIDEVIDLSNAPVSVDPELSAGYDVQRSGNTFSFTPKPGGVLAAADGSHTLAAATPGLFPFKCEGTAGLPIRLSAPPTFSVSVNPTLDIRYTPSDKLERFIVRATPTAKLENGITVTAGFEGAIECSVELVVFRVPIGGPLSLVIGGKVPVSAGFELAGALTVATAGLSAKVELSSEVEVGFLCPGGGECNFKKDLGFPSLKVTPAVDLPSLGDVRFEPSLTLFAAVTAAIGNPFLRSLSLDAFKAKLGGSFQLSLAAPSSQMADPAYRSEYKVTLDTKATVGPKLKDVAKLLGLSSLTAVELAVSSTLARSPAPAAASPVTADRVSFTVGDTVTFRVALDPSTVNFFPALGPYNVKQIVLVRGTVNPSIAGVVTATSGQTEFTIPFAAAGPGTVSEFTAFVVTTLLPLQVFALEVGRAVGAGIAVSPSTAAIATGGTATFTATVTGLASNQVVWSADGGSISQAGVYTAPATIGTFRVRATSAVNSGVFGEAVVTVNAPPRPFVITFTEARVGFTISAGSQSVSNNFSGGGSVVFPDRTVSDAGSSASMANTRASVTQEIVGLATDLVSAGQTALTTTGSGFAGVDLRTQAKLDVLDTSSCTLSATVTKTATNPLNSFGFLAVVRGPGGEKARLTATGSASFACTPGEYDIQTGSPPFTSGNNSAIMNYSVRLSIR